MESPERPRLGYTIVGWLFAGIVAPILTAVTLLLLAPIVIEGLEKPSCDDPKHLQLAIPTGATSESTLFDTYDGVPTEYVAEFAIDGDTGTAWGEGEDDFGKGAALEIAFMPETDIQLICIANGFTKSQELYLTNARIRQLQVDTSQGMLRTVIPIKSLDDFASFQEIPLVTGPTSHVILTILTTSAGQEVDDQRYSDTLVSELEFWGN